MTEAKVAPLAVKVLAVLACLWLMAALPFLTDTGCNILISLGLAASWLVLGIGWLALLPLSWRSGRRWWSFAGSVGCLGLILAFTNVGLILRIALCEASLA